MIYNKRAIKMDNILVVGNGFIANHLPYDKITDRIECSDKYINNILNKYKPTVLINCILKYNNINWCETHQSETYVANTVIPAILAHECDKLNIRLIQLGSCSIFSGKAPHIAGWKEDDLPNAKSYYSKTKASLDAIIGDLKNTTILRILMATSSMSHPNNLFNKILGYKQVLEEPNSVTFMDDFVRAISYTIEKQLLGIYHVVNDTPITHGMLLSEYQKYFPNFTYESILAEKLDTTISVLRSNCIISNKKFCDTGFSFTPVDIAIKDTVRKFVKNKL
jgi:dTDP-4-dehydrorhamnose reductase